MEYRPLRFVGEEIAVQFDEGPTVAKMPGCPSGFIWREQAYRVREMLSEWHNYERRGRMSRNMTPRHLATASLRGSWGVGRDYYRVRTDAGQVFDLYYDRAPKDPADREGRWFLYREMTVRAGS
jgi:hypothetical protein